MIPVSIIMSTWNRAPLLARGLASIYAQKYKNLEVVVVDDGSTDDTKEICQQYPVKYIYNSAPDRWKCPGKAQNIGIRNATHDIIILQSPEVIHLDETTIHDLVTAVADNEKRWVMAHVLREHAGKSPELVSGLKVQHRWAYFLCALWKKWLLEIRGVDEDYVAGGYEDNDLADRLIDYVGLEQIFTDEIHGLHLLHEYLPATTYIECAKLYLHKTAEMKAGRLSYIRNNNREWGKVGNSNDTYRSALNDQDSSTPSLPSPRPS